MEENILAAVDALYTPEPPTAGRPAGAARQPHPEWSAKEKGGGGGGGPPPQAVRGGPPTYGPLSEITMSMVSGGAADAGGGAADARTRRCGPLTDGEGGVAVADERREGRLGAAAWQRVGM